MKFQKFEKYGFWNENHIISYNLYAIMGMTHTVRLENEFDENSF